MEQNDSLDFKKIITDAEIAFTGFPTKESLNYMPYGSKIRDVLYQYAMNLLNQANYQRVILSDFVDPNSLVEIDNVSKISSGYMRINGEDLMMAAGHEVNAYLYIKELLKHYYEKIDLPIRIYNFGPVFRAKKNTKFPFNLGERKSFLECYAVFKTEEEAEKELEFACNWNRKIIKDLLHLPSVESIRPLSTNKKISRKTVCIDSITPLEETVITGMTYFHKDIFTRALSLKYKNQTDNKNKLAYSVHFGLSENILFSYLLNSFDGENLRLYSFLAPIQVSIMDSTNGNIIKNEIINQLNKNNIRNEVDCIAKKKITSRINRNALQGIPITLLLKEENEKLELSFFRGKKQCIIENISPFDAERFVDNINKLLEENDNDIRNDMMQREKDSIVDCNDINILDDIVKKGKVARIHLNQTDDSVHKLESYLTGGEVLGFGLNEEIGKDIITNEKVNTIAYVSRRS